MSSGGPCPSVCARVRAGRADTPGARRGEYFRVKYSRARLASVGGRYTPGAPRCPFIRARSTVGSGVVRARPHEGPLRGTDLCSLAQTRPGPSPAKSQQRRTQGRSTLTKGGPCPYTAGSRSRWTGRLSPCTDPGSIPKVGSRTQAKCNANYDDACPTACHTPDGKDGG